MAFRTLREWVDDFDLPVPDTEEAQIPLDPATGVCIILRQSGRVVGIGRDVTGSDLMLRRAAGRALSHVLSDSSVSQLPEEFRNRIGPALTVQLEIAGRLEPLLGTSLSDYPHQLDPGLDGLAARRGNQLTTFFPSEMLALNTAHHPLAHWPRLARDLGLDAAHFEDQLKQSSVTMYRFRTLHLAQSSPDTRPMVTIRGDHLVPSMQIDRESLQALADRLADHILNRIWPGEEPLGLMGDYRPVSDDYHPLIAPPTEQALAIFALNEYTENISHERQAHVRTIVRQLLDELSRIEESETDPTSEIMSSAAIVFAITSFTEIELNPAVQKMFDAAVTKLTTTLLPQVDQEEQADFPQISPLDRAVGTSALTRIVKARQIQIDPEQLYDLVDQLWASSPPHRQISLLPWLAWAEMDIAALNKTPLRHTSELLELRTLLEKSQLVSPGSPDLAGGLALTNTSHKSQATAQATRPAVFLASALAHPELTSVDEIPVAQDRLLQLMRFFQQLTIRQANCWTVSNPGRALGGLRSAPWDNRQPLAAQIMCLMAVNKTLYSLDTVASHNHQPPR